MLPPILMLLPQLFDWGQAILEHGKPLIEDVVAAFKKHGVESDLELVNAAANDAAIRQARRQAELDS
jgi:hypothetical protein